VKRMETRAQPERGEDGPKSPVESKRINKSARPLSEPVKPGKDRPVTRCSSSCAHCCVGDAGCPLRWLANLPINPRSNCSVGPQS
jgi:hypothetical protein